MKRIITMLTSALLCMTMLVLGPTQVVASAADGGKKYISEVKVGMGETSDQAAKELKAEGFTILANDKGEYADLNKDAGSHSALKDGPNQKIVYFGYKTTNNADDAITDLAVMNMEGGFSYNEYNKLMDDHMNIEIKPFVNRFIATLTEYRENLKKPKDSINYKRADYYRTMLNKLTDDDTGGKPLGDLLVNKTKYEMGDAAYNALSDSEKKNHCDILTLLMQGNGQAVMLLETELTKAADSRKTTWLEKFLETDLDSMTEKVEKENPGFTPSEINSKLDKLYGDDAKKILAKWSTFGDELANYKKAVKKAKEVVKEVDAIGDTAVSKNASEEEKIEAAANALDSETSIIKGGTAAEDIAVKSYLESTEYRDGTLLDFFERDKSEFDDKDTFRELYPIVASLSGGQLAGLDFLSLKDMILMAITDESGFKEVNVKDITSASIYQDVNREIYDRGGVALTDDALREDAKTRENQKVTPLSSLSIVLWSSTAFCGTAALATVAAKVMLKPNIEGTVSELNRQLNTVKNNIAQYKRVVPQNLLRQRNDIQARIEKYEKGSDDIIKQYAAKSKICNYIAIGFSIAMAILAGVSIYTTIRDMKAYYKVTFAPIPKYMVDRTDISGTNAKGDPIMIRNQTAYYKVVSCNRTEGDSSVEKENYKILGDRSDLNGDVGQQWLALYSVKYENGLPILADSLKLKMGDGDAPKGYTTGIHMFGDTVPWNLTYPKYAYNDPYDGTYVYFKNDTATVKDQTAAGSLFSGGSLAIGAVLGLVVGGSLAFLLSFSTRKRRERAA